MLYRTLSLSLALVLFTFSASFAQSSTPRYSAADFTSRRMAPPEAPHSHSSTPLEGALRGRAVLRSATGDYILDASKAALIQQHVEFMHYDNDLKKTHTALLKKRMIADYRDLERQQKRMKRERAHYERGMVLARKHQLDEYQFNWETGRVYWPALVASPRYAEYRLEIDRLMNRITRYGFANDPTYRDQVAQAYENFRRKLCEDARNDHPATQSEYAAMNQFLLGIKYAPHLMAKLPEVDYLSMSTTR